MARQWVTIHPIDADVAIRRWVDDAKELDQTALAGMVELLSAGTEYEQDVAATVLRFRGYQVLLAGDSNADVHYQVTDPTGAAWPFRPDGDSPERDGPDDLEERPWHQHLRSALLAYGSYAVIAAGAAVGAAYTTGAVRLALIILAALLTLVFVLSVLVGQATSR
jgi:hypothetical protein